MENKINIAELLKDCPQGMELDCTMYEDCKLLDVDKNPNNYVIRIATPCGVKYLDKYGCYTADNKAKCVIFPKGKTSWEGFVPPCKFKDGDILITTHGNPFILKEIDNNKIVESYCGIRQNGEFVIGSCHWTSNYNLQFANKEEKEKLFKAIKENGYRWNAKAKTLEKLIEPKFNVGDKVQHKGATSCGSVYEVEKMRVVDNHIEYTIKLLWYNNCIITVAEEDLQPYKEETMETITIDDFKTNTKEWLIDKLHNMIISDAIKTIGNIHDELHKPEYPKTFIDVLNFWHPDRQPEDDYQRCYKKDLIEKFQDLLYARDAYLKIAGDWKPDWEDETEIYYTISYDGVNIKCYNNTDVYSKLAFPTAEMQDAFYENFKDLIEKCKTFL